MYFRDFQLLHKPTWILVKPRITSLSICGKLHQTLVWWSTSWTTVMRTPTWLRFQASFVSFHRFTVSPFHHRTSGPFFWWNQSWGVAAATPKTFPGAVAGSSGDGILRGALWSLLGHCGELCRAPGGDDEFMQYIYCTYHNSWLIITIIITIIIMIIIIILYIYNMYG